MGRKVTATAECVFCATGIPLVFEQPTLMRASRLQAVCGECKKRFSVTVSIPREREAAKQVKVELEAIRG